MTTSASENRVRGFKRGRVPRAVRTQQLLDHAEALYLAQGYEGFSIEDLCRAAEVSRPVVYEHFGTKHGIFLACVARIRAAFDQDLLTAASAADTIDDALRAGGESFFRTAQENPARWSLVYGATTGLVGPIADDLYALRERTVDSIGALLRRFLPNAPDTSITLIAHMVSGAGEQLGRWWLRHPEIARDEVVDAFVDWCRNGVSGHVDE